MSSSKPIFKSPQIEDGKELIFSTKKFGAFTMLASSVGSKSKTLISRVVFSPNFSQALPAESSRQAIQRLMGGGCLCRISSSAAQAQALLPTHCPHPYPGRRRYVTAAALAEESHNALSASTSDLQDWDDNVHVDPPDTQVPRLPSADLSFDHHLRLHPSLEPIEIFRGLITTQPLSALLSLHDISPEELVFITLSDFFNLTKSLQTLPYQSPGSTYRQSRVESALWILHDRFIDYLLPSTLVTTFNGDQLDQGDKRNTARKLLRRFLGSCLRVQAPRIASSVFKACLSNEIQTGQRRVDTDRFARELMKSGMFALMSKLISPEMLPRYLITATLIDLQMRASLQLHDPLNVHRLYRLHGLYPLKPRPRVFHHLVQAYIATGDLSSARILIDDMLDRQIATQESIQLALIRSGNPDKVLQDLERMKIEPSTALYNVLLKLRLDIADWAGAERLSHQFKIPPIKCYGPNEPNNQTMALIIRMMGRTDIRQLNSLWIWICEHERDCDFSSKALVGSLVGSLLQLGHISEVLDIITNILSGSERASVWNTEDYVPDITVFNKLLSASTSVGFEAMEKVMKLMKKAGITPDQQTVEILVQNARTMFVSSPDTLAAILLRLTETLRLRPTSAQLDRIFAQAVYASTSTGRQLLSSDAERSDRTAGLKFSQSTPNLNRLIQLTPTPRERSRPTLQSLSTRLKHEASSSSSSSESLPAAIQTWNTLLAEGHTPTSSHFLTLMQGYSQSARTRQAASLLKLAQETGTKITKEMITVLLIGWGNEGETRRARHVYDTMKRVGMGDLAAQTAMLQIYSKAGNFRLAKKFIDEEILDTATIPTFGSASSSSSSSSPSSSTSSSAVDEIKVKSNADRHPNLDPKSLMVIGTALQKGQNITQAIDLVAYHSPITLTPQLRKLVRRCKNYLTKILKAREQQRLGPDSMESSNQESRPSGSSSIQSESQSQSQSRSPFQSNSQPPTDVMMVLEESLEKAEKMLRDDAIARPLFTHPAPVTRDNEEVSPHHVVPQGSMKGRIKPSLRSRRVRKRYVALISWAKGSAGPGGRSEHSGSPAMGRRERKRLLKRAEANLGQTG